MTPGEWMAKAEWEGGIWSALEYGLRARDLDDEFKDGPEYRAIRSIELAWNSVRNDIEVLEGIEYEEA